MNSVFRKTNWKRLIFTAFLLITFLMPSTVSAEIAASHVYHNHMPNFWPYYDLSKYASTPVGGEVRYMFDGQVINLKNNPPSNYTYYLPSGAPMPHDDLVSYYTHHAKTGAYLTWPGEVANALHANHPSAQMQVTMSGAVVNNVNSFMYTNNVPGYNNVNWGEPWRNAYNNLKTPSGNRTLDMIHFTGHHSMGPLVGNDYLLKDLIYQNATLAQPYFLGSNFTSSKGFFPTELGFSERIIPVLQKLGIEWSVIGNNHFSRTLKDYPLLNDPGKDTLVSPPNRADLQNESTVGSWISQPMFNEQQVTYNKFPFASTPHWVKYVDPATGQENKIVGVPVAQAESWEEGYQGSVTAKALKPFEGLVPQKQFFVIAHDGDNSSGRAGDEGTWMNAGNVTYSDSGVKGVGITEYLKDNKPAASDVVHVQDGSWIDTRDSSSDPQWHHWKLPFGIWKGQFADFNRVNGTNYAPKKNLSGADEGMTVSFEYGYHYLERNFALLQAALNHAKTAEQIWLDDHPNYWQPTTTVDKQITYSGNQLNPWMMSFPVKGDAAKDYAGGANPAELSWYFLTPAIDSGFGYYDENVDDGVKPTLSFNQSLYFSKPYTTANASKDRTGPSVWWPQRWPYNPGSANTDKSEGWTLQYFDNTFGIYTYAYDMSGITDIKVKVRKHTSKTADAADNTFRVYDPAALKAQGVANIDPAKVGQWVEYPMQKRDLKPDINGVDWQASGKATMQKVPAQEIGDLYYAYMKDYRDELLDYYIEATDAKGNATRSDIQQVYVGAGTYKNVGGKIVEDINGDIKGTYPFVTDKALVVDTEAPTVPQNLSSTGQTKSSITLNWTASTDNVGVTGYEIYRDGVKVGTSATNSYTDSGLAQLTEYTYTVKAYDNKGNISALSAPFKVKTTDQGNSVTIYYKQGYATPYIHYRPAGGTWTTAPGTAMPASEVSGYNAITVDIGGATSLEAVFNNGSGTWDNNGGKNYQFLPGVWTYTPGANNANGQTTSGKPTGGDTVAPTVPAGLTAASKTTTSVTLNWTASSDNVGVTGYEVYRNGTKVGTTATASYTDSGLAASTTYSYTVKAYDAAGNISAASTALSVTTSDVVVDPHNTVTIYYKQGYTTPYIHYRPAGGTWTTAPGTAMPASEIAGYNKYTVDIGSAANLEAVFNNGNGTWDNNGSKNYQFLPGTWTYTPGANNANGQTTSGKPTGGDTVAPTVPAGLTAASKTTTSVTLSWTASSDNVGVTGYEVYRNGAKVGTTATTSYTDSGLTASTAYSYTLKAYDAAGNLSAVSEALSVTTSDVVVDPHNTVTLYYKQGYTTPYIHYLPAGGTWTTAPGVAMPASEVAGYNKYTVDIGSAANLEAVFNNGSGTWDNNGGKNYLFSPGVWTFNAGSITQGAPVSSGNTTLTAIVSVPSTTTSSDSLYLASSLNSWNAADSAYKLTRNSDGTYQIVLTVPVGTQIQYKVTRGSWNSVEVSSSGADISNRTYTMPSASSTISLTVQRWKDK